MSMGATRPRILTLHCTFKLEMHFSNRAPTHQSCIRSITSVDSRGIERLHFLHPKTTQKLVTGGDFYVSSDTDKTHHGRPNMHISRNNPSAILSRSRHSSLDGGIVKRYHISIANTKSYLYIFHNRNSSITTGSSKPLLHSHRSFDTYFKSN